VSTIVEHQEIPTAMRSLATLDAPDYVDFFTAAAPGAADWSSEQWARALLEDAPSARRFAFIPWRIVLQLRLGPRHSRQHVHGWRIAACGDDWIRVEAASWCMTAQAVLRVEEEQVAVSLFVRYDRPPAALVWPRVSVIHRRAMPVILHQAVQAHERRRAA
jgi:hypothetical protein